MGISPVFELDQILEEQKASVLEFNAACVYIVGDLNFDQTNWLSMTSTTPDQ